MRKKIIAGNWKMNKTVAESAQLAADLAAAAKGQAFAEKAEIVVCPTYLALDRVSGILKGSPIKLGAQDAHWGNQGAFTGKVSVDMLKALGVTYVILGHSEPRTLFGETDADVNKKTLKVLAEGLIPIVCVGETLSEREAAVTEKVVGAQVRAAYAGVSAQDAAKTVIAYEPVWAIGTGRNASDDQAQAVHKFIRGLLLELYGAPVAEAVRIQYGGSMKPENAAGLLKQPDVDGGLIGGASLKVDAFLGIIKAA
ncbi:MAG TPA: triose-phosphate isomerase [Fibrobacteria bacterium]|nr:triose-phosphate isomerase [Fibrobacteria bacterium]